MCSLRCCFAFTPHRSRSDWWCGGHLGWRHRSLQKVVAALHFHFHWLSPFRDSGCTHHQEEDNGDILGRPRGSGVSVRQNGYELYLPTRFFTTLRGRCFLSATTTTSTTSEQALHRTTRCNCCSCYETKKTRFVHDHRKTQKPIPLKKCPTTTETGKHEAYPSSKCCAIVGCPHGCRARATGGGGGFFTCS